MWMSYFVQWTCTAICNIPSIPDEWWESNACFITSTVFTANFVDLFCHLNFCTPPPFPPDNCRQWPASGLHRSSGLSEALQPLRRWSVFLVSFLSRKPEKRHSGVEPHLPNSQAWRNCTLEFGIHRHRQRHFVESKCESVRRRLRDSFFFEIWPST